MSATLPTNPDVVLGGYDPNVAEQDPDNGFHYSFIPTYSFIDSPNPINSDADMYQITAGSSTPFAQIYGGSTNRLHVRVDDISIYASNYSPGYYRVTLKDYYQGYPQSYYSNFVVIPINVNCSSGRSAAPELTKDGEVTVFPNPSNGYLTVSVPSIENESANISLMNSQGAAIYKQTVTDPGAHRLGMTNQPAGLYLLRVNDGSRQWTKKVLINR